MPEMRGVVDWEEGVQVLVDELSWLYNGSLTAL
jgi:hypothetical protein